MYIGRISPIILSWHVQYLQKLSCNDVFVGKEVLQFYLDNGFDFIFSSDEEEMEYMLKTVSVKDEKVYRKTRLMIFDLMSISA